MHSSVVALPPRRLDEPSRACVCSIGPLPYVALSWLEDTFEIFEESTGDAGTGAPPSVVDLRQHFGSEVNEFMVDAVHFNDVGALAFARGIAPSVVTGWLRRPTSAR